VPPSDINPYSDPAVRAELRSLLQPLCGASGGAEQMHRLAQIGPADVIELLDLIDLQHRQIHQPFPILASPSDQMKRLRKAESGTLNDDL
jgi:hypothetical protein